MMFFGFFFLIALVVIGVLAMPPRYRHHHMMYPMGAPRDTMPEEILRARYARGEISHEEFVQMMHDLHAS